jgi:hypothetical protein
VVLLIMRSVKAVSFIIALFILVNLRGAESIPANP